MEWIQLFITWNKVSNLLNIKGLAHEVSTVECSNSCIGFFRRLHSHESKTTGFASVRVIHDRSLFNLHHTTRRNQSKVGVHRGQLTRPILAKADSRSRVSTLWLRPETWRLFPGLWPPSLRLINGIPSTKAQVKGEKKANGPSVAIPGWTRAPAPARPARAVGSSLAARRATTSVGVPARLIGGHGCTVAQARFVGWDADAAVGGRNVLGLPG
jgi:hypothetical protein